MRWFFYCMMFVFSFGIGGYFFMWVSVDSKSHRIGTQSSARPENYSPSVVLEVEGSPIKDSEVEFEYNLIKSGLLSPAVEDVDPHLEKTRAKNSTQEVERDLTLAENTSAVLRESILSSIVERKVLMEMVRSDRTFNLSQPELFTECVDQWMKTLEQAGPDLELFKNPENRIQLKNRLCELDILRQYVEKHIYADIVVEPKDVKKYFFEHRSQFKKPATVTIRQVVLANEHQARKIRYKMTARNFAKMAKKYSITPEAEQGGLLGPFPVGYGMPRFYDVAFRLKKGQISSILKSTYGFHIIMLVDRTEGRLLSYQEAFEKVAHLLQQSAKKLAYQRWVDDALHSVKVATPRVVL